MTTAADTFAEFLATLAETLDLGGDERAAGSTSPASTSPASCRRRAVSRRSGCAGGCCWSARRTAC